MEKMNQIMEQYRNTISAKLDVIKSGIQAETDKISQARSALAADIEVYQRTTVNAIKKLENELDDNRKQFENVNATYKAALLEGTEEKIVAVEKKIRTLKSEEVRRQAKIDALQVSGNQESFRERIQQIMHMHQGLERILSDAFLSQNALRKVLLQHIEILRKLEKDIGEMYYWRANAGNIDKTIALYESINGPIDVAGHFCGTDIEAKTRFIKGNCSGLENTNAGKLLEKGNN